MLSITGTSAVLLPRLLSIVMYGAFWQDSPNKHGVMGSKSVGEPPLLLSASVLSAFQDALAAAKSGKPCCCSLCRDPGTPARN